jgi:hypothetical protein
MHHEVTNSFKNYNELGSWEMDTWRVKVLSKNQNIKLCSVPVGEDMAIRAIHPTYT